jgi:hypothetical protein
MFMPILNKSYFYTDIYQPLLKGLRLARLNRVCLPVMAVRIPGGLTPP